MKHTHTITIFALIAIFGITTSVFAAQDWNSSRSNKTSKTQSVGVGNTSTSSPQSPAGEFSSSEQNEEKVMSTGCDSDLIIKSEGCEEEEEKKKYKNDAVIGGAEHSNDWRENPPIQDDDLSKGEVQAPGFKAGKKLKDAVQRTTHEEGGMEDDIYEKIGGDDPIPGIDVIVKRDPSSKPIFDEEGNELDGSIQAIVKRTVAEQQNVWMAPPEDELRVVSIAGNDAHVAEVKLNEDDTISIKATQQARLFGFIPVDIKVEAKMDSEGVMQELRMPWFSFLLFR